MKPGEIGTISIAPAQFFEGDLLLGNTNEPAANTKIRMGASQQTTEMGSSVWVESRTDEKGHFRINPYPGVRFGIIANPPDGAPYHTRQIEGLKWESGDASKKIVIRLDPAVQATGTVVDAETGNPLAGVSVQYKPDSIHNTTVTQNAVTGWQNIQKTDTDGAFRITVFSGPGTLLFHAATDSNYVLQESSSGELEGGTRSGERHYAHMFQKINPPALVANASIIKSRIQITKANPQFPAVFDRIRKCYKRGPRGKRGG